MLQNIKNLFHLVEAIWWSAWFRYPGYRLKVIGVTGTDGKTTTSSLIYHILKSAGYKASMITSVHAEIAGKRYDTGFHVTTPGSYFLQKYLALAVRNGDCYMVLEVTSHALSQHRIEGIKFAVGVITNVTSEHLDYHKTFKSYLFTKLSLLRRAKVAVVNHDDAQVYNAAVKVLKKKRIVTYGIKRDSDLMPKHMPFRLKIPGEFNRYNALAAAAACRELGVVTKQIVLALESFSGIKGRMETIANRPFRVIVDFAHTQNSIEQTLKTVREDTRGRLIHVFGSAGLRDPYKRPLMGKASAKYADLIVLTEEDYRTEDVNRIMDEVQKGIGTKVKVVRYPNREDAIKYAIGAARVGDTVIITGKGHEQSLCRGTIEYPWSDQDAVRKALGEIVKKK